MNEALEQARKGDNARRMLNDALVHFSAECAMGEREKTEFVRAQAHDALDAYFDSVAALHHMSQR